MNEIEEYAIGLVAAGGESLAEDDLDEDEQFGAERHGDHVAAMNLGVRMARAIEENRESFLAWFMPIEEASFRD